MAEDDMKREMIQRGEKLKVNWCAVTKRSPLYTIPRGTVIQLRGENIWRECMAQPRGATCVAR